jgi:hypothetical protein
VRHALWALFLGYYNGTVNDTPPQLCRWDFGRSYGGTGGFAVLSWCVQHEGVGFRRGRGGVGDFERSYGGTSGSPGVVMVFATRGVRVRRD